MIQLLRSRGVYWVTCTNGKKVVNAILEWKGHIKLEVCGSEKSKKLKLPFLEKNTTHKERKNTVKDIVHKAIEEAKIPIHRKRLDNTFFALDQKYRSLKQADIEKWTLKVKSIKEDIDFLIRSLFLFSKTWWKKFLLSSIETIIDNPNTGALHWDPIFSALKSTFLVLQRLLKKKDYNAFSEKILDYAKKLIKEYPIGENKE